MLQLPFILYTFVLLSLSFTFYTLFENRSIREGMLTELCSSFFRLLFTQNIGIGLNTELDFKLQQNDLAQDDLKDYNTKGFRSLQIENALKCNRYMG